MIGKRTLMITVISLYFAVSLLASLVIYGACLAAARADQAIGERNQTLASKKPRKQSVEVEQPQE